MAELADRSVRPHLPLVYLIPPLASGAIQGFRQRAGNVPNLSCGFAYEISPIDQQVDLFRIGQVELVQAGDQAINFLQGNPPRHLLRDGFRRTVFSVRATEKSFLV